MGGGVASGIAIPFLGTALEAARVNAENDGAEEAKISFSKGAATFRPGEGAAFRVQARRRSDVPRQGRLLPRTRRPETKILNPRFSQTVT